MLLEFQRDFAAAIGLPAKGPMRVYRNTVLSACVDALRCNYPIVARLLGDEMFETVAAEHVAKYLPRRLSLCRPPYRLSLRRLLLWQHRLTAALPGP